MIKKLAPILLALFALTFTTLNAQPFHGHLTPSQVDVYGALTATSATITNTVSAITGTFSGPVSANSATVTGTLNAGTLTQGGVALVTAASIRAGQVVIAGGATTQAVTFSPAMANATYAVGLTVTGGSPVTPTFSAASLTSNGFTATSSAVIAEAITLTYTAVDY